MTDPFDIAIIGGGPVGAALALALRDSGLKISLLEARKAQDSSPDPLVFDAQLSDPLISDPRALALSYGSRLLLTRLNVWDALPLVSAIKTIHISQKNSFGRTRLCASDLNVPELGYVLPYAALQSAMHAALLKSNVNFQHGASVRQLNPATPGAEVLYQQDGLDKTLCAQLVVLADGGKTLEASQPATVHDYGQSAVIAHVTCSQPQQYMAYERFTPHGPLALLPYKNGYELVWTVPSALLDTLLQWDDSTLLSQLHQHFGDRVGNFLTVGARSSYPLRLKRAAKHNLPHTVLIGNAAQTLHPVAGQGFNLGLRDAWELAQHILRSSPASLGSTDMLVDYSNARRLDRQAAITFTDGLVHLFSNDLTLLAPARAASLSLLDSFPGVKKFVAKRMMFGVNG